jgi:hypothetical protein
VKFGDRFLQLGSWRFGDVDGRHFSIAHVGGKTAMIYRDDGTRHGGPRSDYTTWKRSIDTTAPGISFGDQFIQIGNWRLCVLGVGGDHASICTKSGMTAVIYRSRDSSVHPGPRHDWCCNDRPVNNNHERRPLIGDRYIQIGGWRFGDIDGGHASVSRQEGNNYHTAQIWRSDGTVHGGRVNDWHCWHFRQCGAKAPWLDVKQCANK